MNALLFASYVPNQNALQIAGEYLKLIEENFIDTEVYISINPGSIPEWEKEIRKSNIQSVIIGFVPDELAVDSDASAFQLCLKNLRSEGKSYDLIWFIHSKGTTKDRSDFLNRIKPDFFENSTDIALKFTDPEVGAYGAYACITTDFGSTDRRLGKILELPYRSTNVVFLHTFYVLRGKIVENFLKRYPDAFFENNLVTHWKFDRYFFERDFPQIAEKSGYKQLFGKLVAHPDWNYTSMKKVRKLQSTHKKNNIRTTLIFIQMRILILIYRLLFPPMRKMYRVIRKKPA